MLDPTSPDDHFLTLPGSLTRLPGLRLELYDGEDDGVSDDMRLFRFVKDIFILRLS